MIVLAYALVILVKTMISSLFLWCAIKITKTQGSYIALAVACLIAAVVGLIPFAGPIIAFVTLVVLVSQWTSAEIWPESVLTVFIAQVLALLFSTGVTSALVYVKSYAPIQ